MSKNERKTENVVREELKRLGFYDQDNDIQVDEQKSNIDAVKRLLKAGSKSGGGGAGAPEFIVSAPSSPDFLVVVECKADVKDHASSQIVHFLAGEVIEEEDDVKAKRIQRFAVDGALHYAKSLSREFNVITLGVSGETKKSALISTYLWPKGASKPKELRAKAGATIDGFVSWADYIENATFDPTVQKLRFDELMSFAADLHEFMRDHAKLTESEKPLLVSGTLIALKNKAFASSFHLHTPLELQKEWMRVIEQEIQNAQIPQAKKDNMTQPYSSIGVHPELGKPTPSYPKGPLHELIDRLNKKVWPFISVYHDFDVVGQFYGEFLKYTGGDKKALGIVLTPRHVTELFALLANVTKDSLVLDICAGTGGFLISAMHQMFKSAVTDADRDRIRKNGLVGVEQQPNMFALAASNMILRGDGKANLYQGSCFDAAITKEIRIHGADPTKIPLHKLTDEEAKLYGCDVGMVDPPYSQSELRELKFVKHMLDCLKLGGTGIAIVPMSCALSANALRAEILKEHTLQAVMSMPDELFYPVGVITCIMVFTAHRPHAVSNRKSWFGYWKRDGYTKTKHRGRVDLQDSWPSIRDRWVESFRNREVHAGESVLQKVTGNDEWCAEAYMETDYSRLMQSDFETVVRNYAVYRLLGGKDLTAGDDSEDGDE